MSTWGTPMVALALASRGQQSASTRRSDRQVCIAYRSRCSSRSELQSRCEQHRDAAVARIGVDDLRRTGSQAVAAANAEVNKWSSSTAPGGRSSGGCDAGNRRVATAQAIPAPMPSTTRRGSWMDFACGGEVRGRTRDGSQSSSEPIQQILRCPQRASPRTPHAGPKQAYGQERPTCQWPPNAERGPS